VQDLVFAVGAPLALVCVCAFATGFGFSLLIIWWETALARHVPPNALSRVSAWDWMGSLALMPLGYAIAGPLAATFGARTVLGIGSAIGLVLLALGLAPHQTRALRDGANAASTEQFAHAIAVEASTDA
jgi:MFS family permease